jgi:phosphonate transport system ATP-binding protein
MLHAATAPGVVPSAATGDAGGDTLGSRVAGTDARLAVHDLTMRYPNGHTALRDVSLSVHAGEMVVILGSNGCGKSTLMKCIVGLNRPAAGSVVVGGRDLARLTGEELRVARMSIALVSQHANLVKRRSVLANVCTGALGRHRTLSTAFGRVPTCEIEPARGFLDEVGLAHLADQRAGTLSGGQAQRVAIARALAQRPQVVLADEPVASLDPEAADDVMSLLRRLASDDGLAVVCVLHQPELATRYADRLIGMRSGQIEFDARASSVGAQQISNLYIGEVP